MGTNSGSSILSYIKSAVIYLIPKLEDKNFTSSLGIKYPKYRDHPVHSAYQWIASKRIDDGAETYWRVHDKLYDLTDFIKRHPGGSDWLKLTKGTDITEAFEVHHLTKAAEEILPKYYLKDANIPRNVPFTFKDDGFYKVLKQRIVKELPNVPKGGIQKSKNIADGLATSYIILSLLAIHLRNFYVGIGAGIMLGFTALIAHNFFHQKDNFRMYYFDLSLMKSKCWRVTHALSHHLYTNTINDIEISATEPWLQHLPYRKKSWVVRYLSWIYSPLIYVFLFFIEYLRSIVTMISMNALDISLFLPFTILFPMVLISNNFVQTMTFFVWIQAVGSFYFALVGINAGHHHPDVFHDGDAIREKEEMDWGIFQLDAVMDRTDINSSDFLVLTNFGDHALHHLFPTLDHSLLKYLYPVFFEVCDEFGAEWKFSSQLETLKGQYLQLTKIVPNQKLPKPLKKI